MSEAMTFRVRGAVELGFALGCLLVVIAACLPGPLEMSQRLIAIGVFGASAAMFVFLWRRRRTRLIVAEQLHYESRGRVVTLPLEAARAIVITRPDLRITRPTRYLLRVEGPGGVALLSVERHWLVGGAAFTRAHALAARLGVPVVDPSGEHDRRSRWRVRRWLGRGEEWKLALATLAALALATVPIWLR